MRGSKYRRSIKDSLILAMLGVLAIVVISNSSKYQHIATNTSRSSSPDDYIVAVYNYTDEDTIGSFIEYVEVSSVSPGRVTVKKDNALPDKVWVQVIYCKG